MNYKKIYDTIINKRQKEKLNKKDGYCEKHHIVPSSLGGSNKKDNLVNLTAREHYICHWLLTKMYEEGSVDWIKMIKAFHMLAFSQSDSHDNNRYMPSRKYDYFKTQFSKAQSINQSRDNNSQYGKVWMYNEDFQQSKKVQSVDVQTHLDSGWKNGRVIDWDLFKHKIKEGTKPNSILKKMNGKVFVHSNELKICKKVPFDDLQYYLDNMWFVGKQPYPTFLEVLSAKNKDIAILTWDEYNTGKFKSIRHFVENTNLFDKSHVTLTKLWKKYIPAYLNCAVQGKPFTYIDNDKEYRIMDKATFF